MIPHGPSRMIKRRIISFAVAAVTVSLAIADSVVLKDGSKIDGTVRRTANGWTVTDANGTSTDLTADSVARIEVGSRSSDSTSAPSVGTHSATAAESMLASLRRSTEAISNPSIVIERYRRFIDQYADTPAAAEAKSDLATWQDRQTRGLVKVGTQWITPAEKSAMASHANETALQAAKLIEQGRSQDAEPLVQSALDADPQSAPALYLRGLMLFAKGQIVPAKKAYESSIAATPDCAAAFNNLAIILWKQNQPMAALQNYEKCLIALPQNKPVLDNVAEALAALPNDQRKNPIAIKLQKRFADQDAQLQTLMEKNGQYRWGSSWVDQATLDKLKAAEQAVNDQLNKLNADATTINSRIAEIDHLTAANNNTMQQLQASAYARDAKGNVVILPLPPQYYTMENDNERMAGERAGLLQKLQGLSEEAKKAQQSMPVPRYTGIQRVIGVEGMPGLPTTQPTTAPSANGHDITISIGPSTAPSSNPTPANGPIFIPLP
ncbi:MAG: tetratricopeptide repeat protein [Phycisphaerae bacterium]|nr:tetratricopeptide repeat protein [Phycisphaerae bacterium]